jgi:hypothetical protein
MAHFAKIERIGNDLVVVDVLVVADSNCGGGEFPQSESVGQKYLEKLGEFRQTSYNANFRKNYAGIGFTFDEDRDAFIPPQPFPSWTLDEESCLWQPPVPYPSDGQEYVWDEGSLAWVVVE